MMNWEVCVSKRANIRAFSGMIKEIEAKWIQDRGFRAQFRNEASKMGRRDANDLDFTGGYAYSC